MENIAHSFALAKVNMCTNEIYNGWNCHLEISYNKLGDPVSRTGLLVSPVDVYINILFE